MAAGIPPAFTVTTIAALRGGGKAKSLLLLLSNFLLLSGFLLF
jgi:hypothetical protein